MRIVLKRIVVLLMVFICNFSFAHNPNEIYYLIVTNDKEQRLTVNFTPLSATNLLHYLKPALATENELTLADYINEFEAYFKKTITLKIDEQPVQLILTDHNLEIHEATLTFALKNVPSEHSQFEITILSYLEFNENILNVVRVNLNGEKTSCILGKNNTTCSSTNKVTLLDYILVFVAIGLVVGLLYFTRRKTKLPS